MNWVDLRLRWPYYLLILLCTFFTFFNTKFVHPILFIMAIVFIVLRISVKYYIPIQKPWKIYLILAVIFVFYLRLNANSFTELSEEFVFAILSVHCLSCIFVLLMRDPQKYDSSYIFLFVYILLASYSMNTGRASYIYAIEVYILASISVFIAIRYSVTPMKKHPIRRFVWYLFTLGLILICSAIFELNSSRIENYLNRFTQYNTGSNKDSMSISSMENIWNNNDELNKIILRAYSKEAPKHLRVSTFDSFRNKDWFNTITGNDVKLDSAKIDDYFFTRIFSSSRPNFESPDCTIFLSMMASGQILTTDKTTWIKTNSPLKRMEANGYIGSYAGRSGYNLYHTNKRPQTVPKTIDNYKTAQLNLSPEDEKYIKDLSDSITHPSDSINTKVAKIHQYLLSNHAYDIKPKIPKTENPILYFLRNKSNAHCQYFSSASVFLLRAQNIPCRIASGYLCVRYNNFGEYWISKGIDSHAWVEYYDNGWQTFDPTEGARITDETKLFMDGFASTYDYISFKVSLWAWQIFSGEFKEYLGKKWDDLIDIIIANVNLIYFLATTSLLYILYVKFYKHRFKTNELLLVYSPPNANKKQIVAAYLKILQILKNKDINIETKDTIDNILKKIDSSDLNQETKNQFIQIINTYQMNRFKPDSI